jgi:hypothetical protein
MSKSLAVLFTISKFLCVIGVRMRAISFLLVASIFGGLFGYVWSSWSRPVAKAPALSSQPTSASVEKSVYFSSCAAARNAGAAPLYSGQPGYSTALDPDGDGIACQPGAGG